MVVPGRRDVGPAARAVILEAVKAGRHGETVTGCPRRGDVPTVDTLDRRTLWSSPHFTPCPWKDGCVGSGLASRRGLLDAACEREPSRRLAAPAARRAAA